MTSEKDETVNYIDIVVFRREKDRKQEVGLRFNFGGLNIIDEKGNVVDECWDYSVRPEFGIEIGYLLDAIRKQIKEE